MVLTQGNWGVLTQCRHTIHVSDIIENGGFVWQQSLRVFESHIFTEYPGNVNLQQSHQII